MNEADTRLATRRAELVNSIAAAADAKSPGALAKLEAELQAIDALRTRLRPARPAWLAPLAVGTSAVLIVALASLIHRRPAAIELDANVTGVAFQIGPEEIAAPQLAEGFEVVNFELVNAAPAAARAPTAGFIRSMTILPGSRIELRSDDGRCLQLTARGDGGGPGVRLITAASRSLDEPDREWWVGAGTQLAFCVAGPARLVLTAPPRMLEFSRLQNSGPPEVRASAMVSGSLRFNDTGRVRALGRLDWLRLGDIRGGSLAVSLERQLRVTFAGGVGDPRALQAGRANGLDLTPTVLDIAANSPTVQSLFGLLTGLAGMLWAASRYLSGSRRR